MTQLISFDDRSGLVCKFNKSLYGLKQSSRVSNEKLNKVLLSYGLKRREVEQCIYFCKDRDKILILAIYVGYGLIFASALKLINNVKRELSTKFKKEDSGEAALQLTRRQKL